MSMGTYAYLQPVAAQILSRSILYGPRQGYLLSGSYTSGVEEAALWFSRGLNCEHPSPDGDACGTCKACRSLATGIGPDVLVLNPEGGTHRIETLRNARSFCSLKSVFGRYKVLIINRAEALTPQAASSLLKLLEEPPDFCVIILCSFDPDSIPDTIRSRLVHVRFGELPIHAIKERLRDSAGINDEKALEILALSLAGTPNLWRRLSGGLTSDSGSSGEEEKGGDKARTGRLEDEGMEGGGPLKRSKGNLRTEESMAVQSVRERLIHCIELGRRVIEFCKKPLCVEVLDIADEMAGLEEDFLAFSLDAMMTMLRIRMFAMISRGGDSSAGPTGVGSASRKSFKEGLVFGPSDIDPEDIRRLKNAIAIISEARRNLARKVNPKLLMEVTVIEMLEAMSS
ncbi:MAG TPA: hypothetical protein GX507_06110 [Clostridia bacterium]|nr:hypothetical protein [Clostridia bacterium]